ncbi:MAG TPA: transporter substrate-binding domain-containing protein [Stellaceae bacterium]|nr:transporter substrate-binding domain-containing protein [Stellaceae bacterium]
MRQIRLTIWLVAALAMIGAAAPASADSNSILNDVLHRGSVRIAVNTGNEPRQFADENGNLQGYDIDIANELAKQLGVTIEFIRTDVAGRVAMLQSHKADITIATFTPTLDRLKTVAFTDPYTTDVLTLMTRGDRKDLATLKDFDKPEIKIALGRGSTAAKALAQYVPHATVVELPGLADIVQAIDAGQVDATCSNDGLVAWTVKKSNGKYRVAATLGDPEDDSIGLPQGDFVWWMWLNQFVHQINADGTNYAAWQKWFGTEPPAFVKPPPKKPS